MGISVATKLSNSKVIISYTLLRFAGFLISILPFRLIYILSDFSAFLLWKVINYREEIIDRNILIAFKGKSISDRNLIKKRFYHNFTDVFLEALKLLSFNKTILSKRIIFTNKELLDELYRRNLNPVVMMGHNCNWEWLGIYLPIASKFKVLAVYKPLSNRVFDRLMYKIRSVYGTKLIPVKETFKALKQEKNPFLLLLISDQSPKKEGAHIVDFFGVQTPFFTGASKIAKMMSTPILFLHMNRISRGYYEVSAKILVENASLFSEEEITQLYATELEKQIIQDPPNWLWSHNRWKHTIQ